MLRERCSGTKSFFRHYISNLPVGVPGIPLFFSQNAIKALEEYPPLRCVSAVVFQGGVLLQAQHAKHVACGSAPFRPLTTLLLPMTK